MDGQRIVAYPASSRLFVWESRRLLSQEVSCSQLMCMFYSYHVQASYADSARHYGFYIDGDIAKLPGGGRRGAAVLCELIPGELAADPNPHQPTAAPGTGAGAQGGRRGGGYRDGGRQGARGGAYPMRGGRYPGRYDDDDGGYPSYPQGR